ncbi:unnamed protein product [Blepharisma stoltei]|uniref:Protein kinase domain-containing protein n=1 Tax=Blepharisma stoltei TaxID=1481888 RepID=A0AAU9KDA0_9CILI|nr:unnamed protein product [Blepharisma stoltei]
MGSSCCSTKSAVEVSPNKVRTLKRSNTGNSVADMAKMKRSQLFYSEGSESTFADVSSSRMGKMIKWRRGDLIGEGAYAKVYQGMNLDTGELIAIKHLETTEDIKKIEKEYLNLKKEILLLKMLDHPNIVRYYQTDLSEDMDELDIILEYVSGGSLQKILQKYGGLSEEIIKHYGQQLLEGLAYLHENFVIHRDLKSANVLIASTGQVKLSDFGSSRQFEELGTKVSKSLKGSPYWMAPEIVMREGHSYSADIWSYGCLLIEIASGRPPWSDFTRDAKEVLRLISLSHSLPTIPKVSQSLQDLILKCLNRDPQLRPSARELLRHDFFRAIEDETVTSTIPVKSEQRSLQKESLILD